MKSVGKRLWKRKKKREREADLAYERTEKARMEYEERV
jgi:hypothetical protein